jgi:hypothetical protein
MNTIERSWPVVFSIALTLSAWAPPVAAEEVLDATVAQPSISTPTTTAVSAAAVPGATVAQPLLSTPATTATGVATKPRPTKTTVRKSPPPKPALVRLASRLYELKREALPHCCAGFPLILGVGY